MARPVVFTPCLRTEGSGLPFCLSLRLSECRRPRRALKYATHRVHPGAQSHPLNPPRESQPTSTTWDFGKFAAYARMIRTKDISVLQDIWSEFKYIFGHVWAAEAAALLQDPPFRLPLCGVQMAAVTV